MDLLWLDHNECNNLGLVGGKVASLSRLAATYPVPPGFCVTTTALERWTERDGVHVPEDSVRDALIHAYRALAEQCGTHEHRPGVQMPGIESDDLEASGSERESQKEATNATAPQRTPYRW